MLYQGGWLGCGFAASRQRSADVVNMAPCIDLILDNFGKFGPVIREPIEYFLRLITLTAARKNVLGKELLDIYGDKLARVSYLEYSRMYMLHQFAKDGDWNSEEQYVKLYNDATDEFSRRELLLAMGRSKKDFWFRSRKQSLHEMSPWIRRAFISRAAGRPGAARKPSHLGRSSHPIFHHTCRV